MSRVKTASPKKKKVEIHLEAAPSIPSLQTGKLENWKPGIIQACMIFYNDTPELVEAALKSVRPAVDRIVAVDGAFAEFPYDKPWSTDGTLDIMKKYADVVIEAKEPWKDQIVKRSQYFTLKDPNDYYLIFDTDEIFTGVIPRKELGEDCYAIRMHDCLADKTFMVVDRFRLIRHQENIHHRNCHAEIWIGDKPLVLRRRKKPYPILEDFIIEHHAYLRPTKRQEADAVYMRARNENEHLTSPYNNLGDEPEEPYYRMLFTGHYYAGDDGYGNTFEIHANETHNMSPEAAKGVLESWPEQWKIIKEVL